MWRSNLDPILTGHGNALSVGGYPILTGPVLRTPSRNVDAVAEMTVALLMAVNRFVVAGDRDAGPARSRPPGLTGLHQEVADRDEEVAAMRTPVHRR